jgi:hypothetical protein
LKDRLDRFEHTDSQLLVIKTDNASSNDKMTWWLQTTVAAYGIEWPALSNHIPCVAHIIHQAVGALMSSLGVKGRIKSWEAHECDKQFVETESLNIGEESKTSKRGQCYNQHGVGHETRIRKYN